LFLKIHLFLNKQKKKRIIKVKFNIVCYKFIFVFNKIIGS